MLGKEERIVTMCDFEKLYKISIILLQMYIIDIRISISVSKIESRNIDCTYIAFLYSESESFTSK